MIVSILIAASVGVLNAMLALLFEHWCIKNGYIRKINYMVWPILLPFGIAIIKIIWFYNDSWLYFIPPLILAETVGINRADLWTTMNRGKWWWVSNKEGDLQKRK